MESAPRMRLLTALVLVVVFVSGAVVGLALDRNIADEVTEQTTEDESAGERGERRRVPMYEQVGPNESQMASIDSIVKEYRKSMRSLHREFREAYDPRYQALIEETREAIKTVLDPEQAMAYDSLVAEYERRRAERDARNEDRE